MENRQEESLLSRLTAVWRRRQTLHAAAGMLAFFRWAVPLFLAGMAIDWLTDLPAPGRVVILATLLGVSAYKAWRCGWRHTRAFDAAHTALLIEGHLGGLESLLVTAVQFRAAGPPRGTSESLCNLTRSRAEEAAVQLRAEEIVGFHGLRRPAGAAVILALFIGVFAFVNGPFLAAGLARIFAPWLAISYPTRTQLDVASGDMVVKEGDSARIRAGVSGVIPSRAQLALQTGTGTSRVHELAIADGGCEYTIETVYRGFDYRITAGDAQSPWHSVQVIASPRIQRAEVSLEFPPYTERPVETVEALTVTVPEGTGIQWRLTLDRAVSKADFIPAGEESLPLDISPDGRVVTIRRVATESRAYSFSWVEREHGFSFTSPRYYLQVAPDQPPHVEITSPRDNLYATLGRKINLAFRGRDDHGIGESAVAYRVNKTDEVKVPFSAPALRDGGEQRIDWDYRSVLPDLAVGDTVSFAVELADRYPGPSGPHRVRSEARRVSFLSMEDYLEQIAKQKRRLLSQLQTMYREERAVHDIVSRLDPSDAVFIQTCQLEAVRQDLIRERLDSLTKRMRDLIEDLAANNIPDETHTTMLVRLSADIQTIADEHVGGAASSLRALASVSGNGTSGAAADPAPAVHKVNTAAREIGCLVLQLGYREAAEVTACELHATAQTQAFLRRQTIMPGQAASDTPEALSKAQERLAQWLSRLLAAAPLEKESTIKDALVAFNLSRLAKQLLNAGTDAKMRQAAALIRSGGSADAARLQAEVIQALLRAEFRLRVGSEYEALCKARDLFVSQAEAQKALRAEMAALPPEAFNRRQSEIRHAEVALQRNLQLLLMPSIPAPRPRLFDTELPPPPPVNDLLAAAEDAMKKAAAHIDAADRSAAGVEQQRAEKSFEALADIVRQRIEAMTEAEHLAGLLDSCADAATKVGQFQERQLSLIEKTQDVAADKADSAYLADLQQRLTDDIEKFRAEVIEKSEALATRPEEVLPLQSCLDKTVRAMTDAGPSLRENRPAQAIAHQKAVLGALKEAESLLADQSARMSFFLKVVVDTWNALAPGPYVDDIEAEQRDLIAVTRKAKSDDLPGLAMPQKNLVHAVNAVLASLDVLAHKIESGTAMLFAKTDMDSAAVALEGKDTAEAIDAQTAVADSMHDLQVQLQAVTPQYTYIREITEFVHESVAEAAGLRAAQGELREEILAAPDDAAAGKLAGRQRDLESRAKAYGALLNKATGQQRFSSVAKCMTEAVARLDADEKTAAAEQMQKAEDALCADTADLLALMERLATVLSPPLPGQEPTPEVKLLLEVLALAAQQKDLYWQTQAAGPEQMASLAPKQREFEKRCEGFIPRSQSNPNLVAAKRHIGDAAAKMEAASRVEAAASQHEAGEVLRHFIVEYVAKYVEPPVPAGPQDPAPPPDPIYEVTEQDVSIFMPGAVSGKLPKDGRVEWEVLGRRERAALNENFARELPLEYRDILKDYYERLTR